ncbi:MAG: a-factor receptor [Watsoniomyces obsoletus]|nr:MAG: a-factor receptor [Watsoniomyces obsoletus]
MEIDWDIDYDTFRQNAPAVVISREAEQRHKDDMAWWDNWRAQRRVELDAEARKEGWASLSEKQAYEDRKSEERRRYYQELRAKRGPSWRLISSNDPQQAKFAVCKYALNLPLEPECTAGCLEHPIPSFCPFSLIDYRSQDFNDDMRRLNAKGNWTGQELRIETDDGPKALSAVVRDSYRAFVIKDHPIRLPNWAKADPVLKSMPIMGRSQHGKDVDTSPSLLPSPVSLSDMSTAPLPDQSAMKSLSRHTTSSTTTKVHIPGLTPVTMISGSSGTMVPAPSTESKDLSDAMRSTMMTAVRGQQKKRIKTRQRKATTPQNPRVKGAGISKRMTRAASTQADPISSRTRSRT